MSGSDSADSIDPNGTIEVDPERLTAMIERANALKASGDASFLATVMTELSDTERQAYMGPMLERLRQFSHSDEGPADVEATVEPDGGFRPPDHGVDLPPFKPRRLGSDGRPIPETIGKFKIERELGRGACGAVYLASDEELERKVAVKLSLESQTDRQELLRIEAAKLAQIDSPGIVPVHEINVTESGNVYIVEKYIEGATLRGQLQKGPLSPAMAARIARDMALGLAPAHAKEILHRDLKPENILIGQDGHVWIADFGLAITEDEQQGHARELAGTPPYMSPEQIQGRVDFMDPRSDIWALGVIFYEMLCGKLPFKGKTRQTLVTQICELDPRPLHQRAPDHLTKQMHELFLCCCAKSPSDRFTTAIDLASALEQLIAGGLSHHNILGQLDDAPGAASVVEQAPSTVRGSINGAPLHTGVRPRRRTLFLATITCLLALVAFLSYRNLVNPGPQPSDAGLQTADVNADTDNAMGLDQADGSLQKPWVVAKDGSGSHRTIASAVAAGPVGAVIRVMPGIYDEAVLIKSAVTIEGQPKVLAGGESYDCEIENHHETPIRVECPEGDVTLRNFVVTGLGHRSTQEFNAVHVTAGTLLLDACVISTESYNCVKAESGANVTVRDCRFLDSSKYAISTKSHKDLVVVDSIFRSSGVQLVGGAGQIVGCEFYGLSGLYVQDSPTAVQVSGCVFEDIQKYGISVTNGGKVVADDLSISQCQKGIWAAGTDVSRDPGTIELRDSRIENCARAVEVQGGVFTASDDTRISNCRIAVGIDTGTVTLSNCSISDASDFGIIATRKAKVTLNDCTIERCDSACITLPDGELSFIGGKIRTDANGIVLGDKVDWPKALASAVIESVEFSSAEAGIIAYSGPVSLTNVTFRGGTIGLFANGPEYSNTGTPTVAINVETARFISQSSLSIFAEGDTVVTLDTGTWDAVARERNTAIISPARIEEADSI